VDSLSQYALGAAVGVAVMGRRTAVWKAALVGGLCGTLPDLDALIDHGDVVRNVTFHRAESHALLYLTAASPVVAWLASRLTRQPREFRRWWLAAWLVLMTHALLDAMTIYGTQLALPLTDYPFGVGSIFIIDPLYTLPLLIGLVATGVARAVNRRRYNLWGLALSTLYLGWSVGGQWHVDQIAQQSLPADLVEAPRLVTATAFNTVLWRIVVMDPSGERYLEGFYSLLDRERRIHFTSHARDAALFDATQSLWAVARIEWFTHGFFSMREQDGIATITDLRMGQQPDYPFSYAVARADASGWAEVTPAEAGSRGDVGEGLAWLWRRLKGQ